MYQMPKAQSFCRLCRSEPRINYVEGMQSAVTHGNDFEVNRVDYYVASLSTVPKSITTVLKICAMQTVGHGAMSNVSWIPEQLVM